MARPCLSVTVTTHDASAIPDAFLPGIARLKDFHDRGILDIIATLIPIRRQGGYCGLDVFVFLTLFFTANINGGISATWSKLRPFAKPIAALLARKNILSNASLSRALSATEIDLIRPQTLTILTEIPQTRGLFSHPALRTYDANGQPWHSYDLDPTVKTLLHRPLPNAEDLPEPKRQAENCAAPGYAGRKRGELQFRRIDVQNSESGLWIHTHLSPGNGEKVTDLNLALDAVRNHRKALDLNDCRAFVRFDGEFGHVPAMSACRDRDLIFLTRLNRPHLLKDPAILKRLREATWKAVPDSLTPPQRFAADIGFLTLTADKKSRQPDGKPYPPIKVRVLAALFGKSGEAKRGVKLDGEQVELFATDLPPEGWPAEEVVSAYFGRTGQENRFAQEDRELGLDRIFSYHLPGQELAVIIGLMMWNQAVVEGFEQEPPPHKAPVQRLRSSEPVAAVSAGWPRDPVVVEILGELDWDEVLKKRVGWSMEASTGELCCPDGRALKLTTARAREHRPGRSAIIFRRPVGGCQDCPVRSDCLRSADPLACKHFEVSVPIEISGALRSRLSSVRHPENAESWLVEVEGSSGGLEVLPSLFLPREARRLSAERCSRSSLRLRVEDSPPSTPRPRLLALSLIHI